MTVVMRDGESMEKHNFIRQPETGQKPIKQAVCTYVIELKRHDKESLQALSLVANLMRKLE